jgi:thiol:disulfide interchange protein DsbD
MDLVSLLSDRPLAALPVVFVGGLLTSLTPCIYPMIPITASVVGGGTIGAPVPRRRAALLTGAYVLGLALTYAMLGLIAGMTGSLFGAVSSNPWVMVAMANLLVVFALMLVDVVPVPVPTRWLTAAATMQGGGRLAGTFAIGAASGLVAAPCGAPIMGAVLGWVAATKSGPLGFLYLFVFSLGMSAVLVMVGLFAGTASRLPRAGMWMVWVKRVFALLMLGTAEYYLITAGQGFL